MQQLQELIVTRLRERGVDVFEAGGGVSFNGTACRVPLRMAVRISGSETMSGHALLALSATTPPTSLAERPSGAIQVRRDREAPRGPADPPIEFSGPTPWPTARQREVAVLLNLINATRLRTGALSLSSLGNMIRFDWAVPVTLSSELTLVGTLIDVAQSVMERFLPAIEGVVVEGFSAETALRRRAPNGAVGQIQQED